MQLSYRMFSSLSVPGVVPHLTPATTSSNHGNPRPWPWQPVTMVTHNNDLEVKGHTLLMAKHSVVNDFINKNSAVVTPYNNPSNISHILLMQQQLFG